jgi:hypothetical protein
MVGIARRQAQRGRKPARASIGTKSGQHQAPGAQPLRFQLGAKLRDQTRAPLGHALGMQDRLGEDAVREMGDWRNFAYQRLR